MQVGLDHRGGLFLVACKIGDIVHFQRNGGLILVASQPASPVQEGVNILLVLRPVGGCSA